MHMFKRKMDVPQNRWASVTEKFLKERVIWILYVCGFRITLRLVMMAQVHALLYLQKNFQDMAQPSLGKVPSAGI